MAKTKKGSRISLLLEISLVFLFLSTVFLKIESFYLSYCYVFRFSSRLMTFFLYSLSKSLYFYKSENCPERRFFFSFCLEILLPTRVMTPRAIKTFKESYTLRFTFCMLLFYARHYSSSSSEQSKFSRESNFSATYL